jgi:hypothetical protein
MERLVNRLVVDGGLLAVPVGLTVEDAAAADD